MNKDFAQYFFFSKSKSFQDFSNRELKQQSVKHDSGSTFGKGYPGDQQQILLHASALCHKIACKCKKILPLIIPFNRHMIVNNGSA